MSDQDNTPADETTADTSQPQQAKVGVKDRGTIVTTAGGEMMSGTLADITDGDD